MSSMLCSHGMALATAMAVSGTVLLLALCRQKPTISSSQRITSLPSRISSEEKSKKKMKKQKRVRFADDVADPVGNGEEFRRMRSGKSMGLMCRSGSSGIQGMPPNHMALYNGIRRDRLERTACSY